MQIAVLGDAPEATAELKSVSILRGSGVQALEDVDVLMVSPSIWVAAFADQIERVDSDQIPVLTLVGSAHFIKALRSWRLALSDWVGQGGIIVVETTKMGLVKAHTVEQLATVAIGPDLAPGPPVTFGARFVSLGPLRLASGRPFGELLGSLCQYFRSVVPVSSPAGLPLAHDGEVPVALHANYKQGHVLYLPVGPDDWGLAREAIADFAAVLNRGQSSRLPRWVDRVVTVGDLALADEAAEIERRSMALMRRRQANDIARIARRRDRRVIYAEGRELWESVVAIFEASGGEVFQGGLVDNELLVRLGGMEHRVRILDSRSSPSAVLLQLHDVAVVVMAERQSRNPYSRYEENDLDQLADIARAVGIALVTTLDLFALYYDRTRLAHRLFDEAGRPKWLPDWKRVLLERPLPPRELRD